VLEHGRRFLRVQTEKGEQGWIDEKAVATQQVFDAFAALGVAHQGDPAVASAVVRDEVNLHLRPGRQTEVFYRLAEGDKVQLLERATLPKPVTRRGPAKSVVSGNASKLEGARGCRASDCDGGLVAGARCQGRTGWLLSHYVDVDAPDSLTRYAEGQRFVGAYVLTTVHDDGVDQDNKDIPIYLTVMAPYTAGLPYDFDQVRVFTWNLKMHRYETAFRDKNIEGYLPVSMKMQRTRTASRRQPRLRCRRSATRCWPPTRAGGSRSGDRNGDAGTADREDLSAGGEPGAAGRAAGEQG
jgi:hypothetical protein